MFATQQSIDVSSNPLSENFAEISHYVRNSLCLYMCSVSLSPFHKHELEPNIRTFCQVFSNCNKQFLFKCKSAWVQEKGVSKGIWVMSNVKPKTTVSYSALYTDWNQCSETVCMITSGSKSVPDVWSIQLSAFFIPTAYVTIAVKFKRKKADFIKIAPG